MIVCANRPFYDVVTRRHYQAGDLVPWLLERANRYEAVGLVSIQDKGVITSEPDTSTQNITLKAEELSIAQGVDVSVIVGTGKGGKITVKDVRKVINGDR